MKGMTGILGSALAACVLAAPASAAVFPVTSNADSGPNTLRQAILDANANGAEADEIPINVTGTIDLLSALDPIAFKTTITGPGPANLTVRAADFIRIFYMNGTGIGDTIRIEGLTIRDGRPAAMGGLNGGGVYAGGSGVNQLDNVVITGNAAPAPASGGGVFVEGGIPGATLKVTRSTITDNRAEFEGGGIANYGELTVDSSTISDNGLTNAVGDGGGIYSGDTPPDLALITNSTIAGNSAPGNGGGLRLSNGELNIESSTIARNTSDSDNAGDELGGGVFTVDSTPTQGTRLANSLLVENNSGSANPVPSQCALGNMASILISDGYNLRSSAGESCDPAFGINDLVDPNPLVGPLSSNGGSTQTIPLFPGSPALNAANPLPPNGAYPACEPLDQRGMPRGGAEGRCDIGAFEGVLLPPMNNPVNNPVSTPIPQTKKKKCKKKKKKGAKKKKKCRKKKRRR